MAEPTITEYTETTLQGAGVFDTMMRGVKAHLEEEFSKNRIKGPEYSQVYLGAVQSVMSHALQFLLEKDQSHWRSELLKAQTQQAAAEAALATRRMDQLDQEILIAKEQLLVQKEEVKITKAKLANIPLEGDLLTAQATQAAAQTSLINEQQASEVKRNMLDGVIDKEICKLNAEFDVLMEDKLKTVQETSLLSQKKATEAAQTSALNVDDGSVIGRQKLLYKAQTAGFARDAEQKAAKIMIDTWNVRRTTDPTGVDPTVTNNLTDADVGSAVTTLLTGIS